ncbi:MAG: protein-L-isoaspartate O-methyltransferase [Elusimicrobia bacterium GWC2_61_19]|nr:MAG: protein-L-isoaspartate O-methyltransferase [Elusimicrobia bacterium GWC2_61_19]
MLGKKYDAYLAFIRKQMIKDQIESRGVKDPRVLAAMDKVCRHCFVTEDMVSRAYEDYPLPIDYGQTISQPYIVALMSELLGLSGGERVLEVGTGSGYQTAVLAELAADVDTVELQPELARAAEERLGKLGYRNINFRTGNGALGWPERAPYDAALITCAAPAVPPELVRQLKAGGRLVIPVGGEDGQELRLITKTAAGLESQAVCAVRFVPMLGDK